MWAKMRKAQLITGIAILSCAFSCISGCASLTREDAINDCSPDGNDCLPELAVLLPLSNLRAYGSELRISCRYTETLDAAYRRGCVDQVNSAIAILSKKWSRDLEPIDQAKITYRDSQVYLDTFIPGREDADLVGYVLATVPLVWRQ